MAYLAAPTNIQLSPSRLQGQYELAIILSEIFLDHWPCRLGQRLLIWSCELRSFLKLPQQTIR